MSELDCVLLKLTSLTLSFSYRIISHKNYFELRCLSQSLPHLPCPQSSPMFPRTLQLKNAAQQSISSTETTSSWSNSKSKRFLLKRPKALS